MDRPSQNEVNPPNPLPPEESEKFLKAQGDRGKVGSWVASAFQRSVDRIVFSTPQILYGIFASRSKDLKWGLVESCSCHGLKNPARVVASGTTP